MLKETFITYIIIFLFIITIGITFDFYYVYKDKNKEAEAKRANCYADYLANKCDSSEPNDPIELKNACLNSRICMETNTVLFQDVFVFYIKNFCSRLFGQEGILQYIFLFVGTIFFVKIVLF